MPRLPIPGSDQGNWGEILNEFLEQAHENDGSLKEVAKSQLSPGVQASLDKADVSLSDTEVNSTIATSLADPASDVAQVVSSTALMRGDWSTDVLGLLGELAPPLNTPTIVHSSGNTTSMSSPVEYRPAACGTGSQVTNWNGRSGPTENNIRFTGGLYQTNNGGNADFALYGMTKPGGGPQAAIWPLIFDFDTSAGVDTVELSWYGSSTPSFKLEVNGQPVAVDAQLDGPSGLTSGKKSLLTFPRAVARRIRVYASGGIGLHAIRVNTGQTITKPAAFSRTGAVIGDSWVGGSGGYSTYPIPGASQFDTWPVKILRALGCDELILAGIGGTGFKTGFDVVPPGNYESRVATVLAMNPDVLIVNGSVNDGSAPDTAVLQAAVESFCDATATIPERYIVGTIPQPFGANHDAVKAGAEAKGVPFINMKDFFSGSGSYETPNGTGSRDLFLRTNADLHPTWLGHRAIQLAVWRQIAALR